MTDLAIKKQITNLEPQFVEMSRGSNAINFNAEITYSCSILKNNSYLLNIAEQNPESLRAAVLNVAGAGISLNPVQKHAYLVPRRVDKKMAICLDVSYMGLIHLAISTGSVRWCHAETVRKQDNFQMNAIDEMPLHNWKPFQERGPTVGVYCVAKLHDGSCMTRVMDMEKIEKIMNSSEAYKAFKSGKTKQCPWVDHFDEMAKKTVIKQASKSWPKSDLRFKNAIEIINKHEGIDFNNNQERVEYNPVDYEKRMEQVDKITGLFGDICESMTTSQKISIIKETTGFTRFEDIKIQGNDVLDEIITKLVFKKTAMETEDGNNLPYVKEEPKDESPKLEDIVIEAEPITNQPKSAKDVKFKIED